MPKKSNSIIKVIGVGGGGSNAVNHMFSEGIRDVEFIICNTDQQALGKSAIPTKVQLGQTLTEGLGAGSHPEIGKNAAIENIDELRELIKDTKMVFVTAGMGGGTGTGAAPVIAKLAREMGILTVGIVTMPFTFEGRKRRTVAEEGVQELKDNVDTIIIINNDKLREIYGNLNAQNAFAKANDVLLTAAKGISEVIVTESEINVDFNDVKTVMTNGGTAIMGYGEAEGENRALAAVEKALSSPLLNDQYISGASQVLLQITSGMEDDQITMDEMAEISEYIQNEAGSDATLFMGIAYDETMGPKVRIIVVATGFSPDANINRQFDKKYDEKKKHTLTETKIETKPLYSAPANDNPYNFEVKIKAKEEVKSNSIELSVQQELPILPKATVEVKSTPMPEVKIEPIAEKKEEPKAEIKLEEPKQEKTNIQSIEIVSEKIIHVLDLSENAIDTSNEKKSEEAIVAQPIAEKPTAQTLMTAQEIKTEENDRELQLKILRERANKLKDFNEKFKSGGTGSLAELENEPAFKRRNISLDQLPHASSSQVSRFSIGDNGENKGEIKTNNSYLHDRAD